MLVKKVCGKVIQDTVIRYWISKYQGVILGKIYYVQFIGN